jgi:hypothetical protein
MADEPDTTSARLASITMTVQQPARTDGYRPISDSLWVWAAILGFPSIEESRLLTSGARRLDSGHRQLERVREGIDTAPPEGSVGGRERMHEVIGDAEMAVIALDKALDVVVSLSGRYHLPMAVPASVTRNKQFIADLRDHYSHIDERALGRVDWQPDAKAEEAWDFVSLLADRTFADGHGSLGIDEEATELCIAARGYLVQAWAHLVARAREEAEATS